MTLQEAAGVLSGVTQTLREKAAGQSQVNVGVMGIGVPGGGLGVMGVASGGTKGGTNIGVQGIAVSQGDQLSTVLANLDLLIAECQRPQPDKSKLSHLWDLVKAVVPVAVVSLLGQLFKA